MSDQDQLKNDELIARAIFEEETQNRTLEWFDRHPEMVEAGLKQEVANIRQLTEMEKIERDFQRFQMRESPRNFELDLHDDFAYISPSLDTSSPSFREFFGHDFQPLPDFPSNYRIQHIREQEGGPLQRAFVRNFREEEKISEPRPNYNVRNNRSRRPANIGRGSRNADARANNSHSNRRGEHNARGGRSQIGIEDYMIHGSESNLEYEDLLRLDDHNFDKGNGLSTAQLAKLRLKPFNSKFKCQSCLICMTDFRASEPVCELGCEDLFHEKCIKEWLSRKTVCPTCKFEVKTTLNKLTRR